MVIEFHFTTDMTKDKNQTLHQTTFKDISQGEVAMAVLAVERFKKELLEKEFDDDEVSIDF